MNNSLAKKVFSGPLFVSLLSLSSCMALSSATMMKEDGANAASAILSQTIPADLAAAPLVFRSVDPKLAAEMNAAIPNSGLPLASPNAFKISDAAFETPAALTALSCMTEAIYYEGGYESERGRRAIAQVVLNRMRHPAYPNTVCGVVFQGSERKTGCQFSFTCDGSRSRTPSARAWNEAAKIARDALSGYVERSVGTATHYHTIWITPYWQASLAKITTIGAHIFYRWAGGAGDRRAFAQSYGGQENIPNRTSESTAVALGMEIGIEEIGSASTDTTQTLEPPVPEVPAIVADRQASRVIADEQQGELIAGKNAGTFIGN
jgi:hypothetical protein